ncbi:homoserine kinase [Candidatus Caldatribacterium saccharofermentans]|uniref:Homoserine kinase n=1 Tax=Candidatus Caldatribacterium saccharofermentans TaxID=1454753 RepID=A0A7V4WL21_9BACT
MKLRVCVPATSANLSCGFDVLGLALDLTYKVEVETTEERSFFLHHRGEGEGEVPQDERNLFFVAVRETWERLGFEGVGLRVCATNGIPIARGLGSSAACIVAGVMVANALCGGKLKVEEMLELAVALEGHPDNVIPAFVGGFTIALREEGRVFYQRFSFPPLFSLFVLIPDYTLSTEVMRGVLPASYPREDVVFSLSHLAFLLGSLFTRDREGFFRALEDRIHEPYRGKYVVGFPEVKEYVKGKGLGNVVISGSGPTLLLVLSRPLEEEEKKEIAGIFAARGVAVRIQEVHPEEKGARVEIL